MTDRTKITLIYTTVGLFALLFVGAGVLVANLKRYKKEQNTPIAEDIGFEVADSFFTLEKDLELTDQTGSQVKLSDLQNKVWVATQFYAACPMCAERNARHLIELYQTYSQHDHFHLLSISIDPEADDIQKLRDIADHFNVDDRKWWFTTGENAVNFMEQEMKFLGIRERTDPLEIQAKGKWAHDLSLEVYYGMTLITKINLEDSEYNDIPKQKAKLKAAIERGLKTMAPNAQPTP